MTLGIREFGSSDMIRDMEHIAQLIRVSSLHTERIVGQGDQFLAVIIAGLGCTSRGRKSNMAYPIFMSPDPFS